MESCNRAKAQKRPEISTSDAETIFNIIALLHHPEAGARAKASISGLHFISSS